MLTGYSADTYKHVKSNRSLCETYVEDMGLLGDKVAVKPDQPFTASTDMGNVSQEVPGFHGAFAIPTEPDAALHSIKFAASAGTDEAHAAAIKSAKGMAMIAFRVLADDKLAENVRSDFVNQIG